MSLTPHSFSKTRVERPIAVVRVVLASSSLFAIWLDPAEPIRYIQTTYTLHAAYLAYSLVLVTLMWNRSSYGRLPFVTYAADIVASSIFQYLTLGPSSPFFVYFVFALFSAALRWGWRATVGTAFVVLALFVAMSMLFGRTLGGADFELNRFIIRFVYLFVVTVLLVYLGQHEQQLREEIQRLARWPLTGVGETRVILPGILQHASGIMGATHAIAVWDADDEPWIYVAVWSAAEFNATRHAPTDLEPLVPQELDDHTFFCTDVLSTSSACLVSRSGIVSGWTGLPLHKSLLPFVAAPGLASAAFRTDRLTGRVFFSGLSASVADVLTVLDVVAREIGTSFEQLYTQERSRQLAVAEDRIRLARDLHDGVLQSLTGIRLELQSMASEPTSLPGDAARLVGIERALALEQRELRGFIDGLKPESSQPSRGTLADQLDLLRQRIMLEWKTPVSVRVSPIALAVPPGLEHAVPLMVHEAIANALKHGRPSRVSVDVQASDSHLRLIVSDDGSGFPVQGRFDHAALVRSNAGPASLRERVASLGGEMTIESSSLGARIEMSVPLSAVHV